MTTYPRGQGPSIASRDQNAANLRAYRSGSHEVVVPQRSRPVAAPDPEQDLVLTPSPDRKDVKRRKQLEHWEQVAYFNEIKRMAEHDPLYATIFAIPNGTPTSQTAGRYMVAEGVKAGVPDILVPLARVSPQGTVYSCLFIEMKEPIMGGELRDSQKNMISLLKHAGAAVAVCDNWRDAWAKTIEYVGWQPARNYVEIMSRLHNPAILAIEDK